MPSAADITTLDQADALIWRPEGNWLVATAAEYGLVLQGWDGIVPAVDEPVVTWNTKSYTFLAIIFVKV